MLITPETFARMVDISALQTTSTEQDIKLLADTAVLYRFKCVFALSSHIPLLLEMLEGREIGVGAPIGFPSGAEMTEFKAAQARRLAELGCAEFDMVMNIGWLKSGKFREVERDIAAVRDAAGGRPLKVIVESMYLTEPELIDACRIVADSGADYIKTGTGWAPAPTELRHVEIIARETAGKIGIKAAGGIRDLGTVRNMCELGVTRFGVSVRTGIRLMEELMMGIS
jgi:deoxyribose-phosphate aldolase